MQREISLYKVCTLEAKCRNRLLLTSEGLKLRIKTQPPSGLSHVASLSTSQIVINICISVIALLDRIAIRIIAIELLSVTIIYDHVTF